MDDDTDRQEQLKALFLYADKLLAALLLLNGGAIVAILSFVSGLWGKTEPSARLAKEVTYSIMMWPIWIFALGIVCTLAAYILAYLTQLDYYNMKFGNENRFHRFSYWAVIAAVGCFFFGTISASRAVIGAI